MCRIQFIFIKMAVKYSAFDKDLFAKILENYPIVDDKKADVYSIDKKKKAWDKITADFNATADEKRSVVQLKRLWDKLKRSRKKKLAEERHSLRDTADDSIQSSPSLQPEADSYLPCLKFEIESDADSNSFNLSQNTGEAVNNHGMTAPCFPDLAQTSNPAASAVLSSHVDELTQAKLQQIQKETQQMEELHKIKIEEAYYKKETARFIMQQEEAKLKQLLAHVNKTTS